MADIPKATRNTIGGVKVGDHLDIASDGTISQKWNNITDQTLPSSTDPNTFYFKTKGGIWGMGGYPMEEITYELPENPDPDTIYYILTPPIGTSHALDALSLPMYCCNPWVDITGQDFPSDPNADTFYYDWMQHKTWRGNTEITAMNLNGMWPIKGMYKGGKWIYGLQFPNVDPDNPDIGVIKAIYSSGVEDDYGLPSMVFNFSDTNYAYGGRYFKIVDYSADYVVGSSGQAQSQYIVFMSSASSSPVYVSTTPLPDTTNSYATVVYNNLRSGIKEYVQPLEITCAYGANYTSLYSNQYVWVPSGPQLGGNPNSNLGRISEGHKFRVFESFNDSSGTANSTRKDYANHTALSTQTYAHIRSSSIPDQYPFYRCGISLSNGALISSITSGDLSAALCWCLAI